MNQTETVGFSVSTAAGSTFDVDACPVDASVGEVIPSLLEKMALPLNDADGSPASYSIRRNRDGMILNDGDVIGNVIQQGETCVLQPSIDAG